MSNKSSWVQTGGIIISVMALSFTIYQFNETQEKISNLEFINQLEKYDDEFRRITNEFRESNKQFSDCSIFAKHQLSIANRISYLKFQGFVNQDFVQFFENDFGEAETSLKWLKYTKQSPITWENSYRSFHEVRDSVQYFDKSVSMDAACYYYVEKISKDSNYDPREDKTDTKTYDLTDELIELIRTYDK